MSMMMKSGPKRCIVRRFIQSDDVIAKIVEDLDKKIIATYYAMENIPCVEPKNTTAFFDRSLCHRCHRSIAECVKLRQDSLKK